MYYSGASKIYGKEIALKLMWAQSTVTITICTFIWILDNSFNEFGYESTYVIMGFIVMVFVAVVKASGFD